MNNNKEELLYKVALNLVPNVGAVNAKSLISYCGSCSNIFKAKKQQLLKIPGIGPVTANAIYQNTQVLTRAEEELRFIEDQDISPIFFFDKAYPQRLKNCADAPILLFYKGNADLNMTKVISIVGTRNITQYGRDLCAKLIKDLAPYNVLVISGLAYGVDYNIHRACVNEEVSTVAVLAHGLDRIYPSQHHNLAKKMLANGGLLTEFLSNSTPDRENFPKRNRIVAGMTDATIVVETAEIGGSIITANLANSYNRDVFAFPGRVNDRYSKGCNALIRKNIAALVTSAKDVVDGLCWEETAAAPKAIQRELFVSLNDEETTIVAALKNEQTGLPIDLLRQKTNLTNGKIASNLLNLEFKGLVKALPGSLYRLV